MFSLQKKTIPIDLKNIEIFNLDSKVKAGLVIFSITCNIISGFSEYLGMAPFITDIVEVLYPSNARIIGQVFGVSLALFLEFLIVYLVGFLIYSIHARYLKIEVSNSIDKSFQKFKFWSAVVALIGLVGLSMTLSKKNVKYQIESTAIELPVSAADKYDDRQDRKEQAVKEQYNADKMALDKAYAENMSLIENEYNAKISAIQTTIETLERKSERSGLSYKTRILSNRKEIERMKEKQAKELKPIKARYDNDLRDLKSVRDSYISSYTSDITADKTAAVMREGKQLAALEKRNNWVAYVLTIISQFSVLGAVFSRAWICMSNATSGIKTKPLPLPESFSDNVLVELITLIVLFPSRHLQNLVRKGLERVPELRQLEEKGAILHLSSANDFKAEPSKFFSSNIAQNVPQNVAEMEQVERVKIAGFLASMQSKNVPSDIVPNVSRKAHRVTQNDNSDFTKKADISKAERNNDRNKEKHKAKQRKLIASYYKKYKKTHGKKPSYDTISENLNIARTSVGRYVRELKAQGKI